jgi:hypothetical protein
LVSLSLSSLSSLSSSSQPLISTPFISTPLYESNEGRSWKFYFFILFIMIGLVSFIVYLVKNKTNIQKIKSVFKMNHSESSQHPDPVVNNSLNRSINSHRAEEKSTHTYYANNEPDGKKWCYVGEYEDVRTCRSLEKEEDVCMSGNIFPSRDICINPNLR